MHTERRPASSASTHRSHVLLITCDELRADALGSYGGRYVATPHLDAIAAAGRRFDRAYTASPWCAPARCSLITGRWPHRHGVYSNFRLDRLSPSIPNLYGLFGAAGYRTTHVGKCHYAPVPYADPKPDRTLDYSEFSEFYRSLGIDSLALQDGKQVSVWFSDDYSQHLDAAGHLDAYRDRVWDRSSGAVFEFPGPAEWHPDAWVGRTATELVAAADPGHPQFLWASFSGPHFPFDPPAEYLDRVELAALDELADPADVLAPEHSHAVGRGRTESGPGERYDAAYWRRLRHHYFANIALIDDQIGKLLAAAQERFGSDLVVLVSADHGEMLGEHGVWGKNDCYFESVLRLPLLLRGPGVPAGTVDDRLISTVDFLPTLLELAGLPSPPGIDGRSLASTDTTGRSVVFAEGEGFLVAADGRHKLIEMNRASARTARGGGAVPAGEYERRLVDHHRDPAERTDVFDEMEYRDVRETLEQAIIDMVTGSVLA